MPTLHATRLRDPDGHYARLGLEPAATQTQIVAAFRARARVLHPDVPRTGNAEAFVTLKRAYDVLSHPDRRAEYDKRAGQAVHAAETVIEEDLPLYEDEPPVPPSAVVPTRMPRLADLPVAVWLGMGALLAFATFQAITHFSAPRREQEVAIRPNAPSVPALPPNAQRAVRYGLTPVHLAGTANFYVAPSSSPAELWRLDTSRNVLVRLTELPPFSTLQGLRLLRRNGMLEVMVTEGLTGYVAFDHVIPGDQTTARRAYCAYNAGPVPQDGEVLERSGHGPATLTVENRAVQPAVLKLRNAAGAVVAALFLNPYGQTDLSDMPVGAYRTEFATGELWSRACNGFTAGMRAELLTQAVHLPGSPPVVIAPEGNGAPFIDIPEQAFEQE